ncbi:MAG: hypothetical protein ACFFEO_02710 [Candidatus Thorarchaeota archaeon]
MKTDAYITKIIQDTGLTRSEIQNLVEEKKGELKGLITDEGALFLIAKDYGVDVRSENVDLLKDIEVNISDLSPNMKNLTIVGRIKDIYRIYDFERENEEKGYVGSFLLHDNTGEIRVVLWNEHVNIFNDENFRQNELVKILNGYTKEGKYGLELHIGRLGKIILSPDDIDYKKYPKIKEMLIKINEINKNLSSVSIEGKIIKKFPVKTFNRNSGGIGNVGTVIVMDNTSTIRVTFWNDDVNKIDDIENGDYVLITSLRPRESNFTPNSINLHATRNTKITKKESNNNIEVKLSDNVKDIQKKENIASFKGIISSIEPLKTVKLKSGDELELLKFIVRDNTGLDDYIRVTAWGEIARSVSEEISVKMGVLISNALLRYNNYSGRKEATIIDSTNLKQLDLDLPQVKSFKERTDMRGEFPSKNITKISGINKSGFFEIKGMIAKELTGINIYNACSKCLKKIENCSCEEQGDIKPRMIINLLIDDESGIIRTAFIGDLAEKLIGKQTEIIIKVMDTPDFEKILEKLSNNLLGKDIYIKGKAKYSDFTNSYELNAFDFQEIDVDYDLEQIINDI